ncbi:MAG: TIGR01212 family radical SAM protein [Lachnospiraceae bacterium]|nr:TIGR01212 family radical SAM protein [Lachnospiraceae bacterium]
MDKPYYSLNAYLHQQFHEKVYKVALNGGMSCPNRDGTLGNRGCIFCSAGGSGDFAGDQALTITEQINAQIAIIRRKRPVNHFVAYFQAYTNTYAPVDYLRRIFTEAMSHPQVVALSIGTRPDCLPTQVLKLLSELNQIKPVWVELGLQTIHEKTARYIRRGYELPCFLTAVRELVKRKLPVIVHLILGLPGESTDDVLASIDYLNQLPISGIKLQLLHVLKGTDLAAAYQNGDFSVLSQKDYEDLVLSCVARLRPDIVIHRLTGDGPKQLLIAPLWSSTKRTVLNNLHHRMAEEHLTQGMDYQEKERTIHD